MPWAFQAVEYHETLDLKPAPGGYALASDATLWLSARLGRLTEGGVLSQGMHRQVVQWREMDTWAKGGEAEALRRVREQVFAEVEAVQWQVVAATPLTVLKLSARPRNALRSVNVQTVEALQHLPSAVVPRLRNLGTKAVAEIAEKLRAWEERQPVDAAASEPYWQGRYDAEVTWRKEIAERITSLERQYTDMYRAMLKMFEQLRKDLYRRDDDG